MKCTKTKKKNWLIFITAESCFHGRARVRGSSSEMVGRIEVCIQEKWRTICSNQWKEEDARVLCHQLGFSVYGLLYWRLNANKYIDIYLF